MGEEPEPNDQASPGSRPWISAPAPRLLTLLVRVTTGTVRARVVGVDQTRGRLAVRLTSPPAAGRANGELLEFLARKLGVRRTQVRIVSGHASRDKRVEVGCDLTVASAESRLLQ